MKKYIIALVAVFSMLPVHAQKEHKLQEVTVVASSTTNNDEELN